MAIALEKKVYNFVTLTVTFAVTSVGFNAVYSLNRYPNYTPENVIEEAAEFNRESGNRKPPEERDGGSRWVDDRKNHPILH